MFPWAGQAVLRSNYTANSSWLFFDVGPFDDGANRRNEGRLRLSWRDLRRVDKPLAAEMLRLAEFYGYDKPRAGDRLRPDS